jgi:CheY-like chemotaxis protein
MKRARVLVVDDDPGICEFVEALLTDEGYEVVSAPHGAAALGLLSRYQPDIILLDMRMPVMDGAEFLHRYYQTPGPYAWVVVMSAAQEIRRVAARVTAAAVIEKPFQITDLLDLLAHQRSAAPAPEQRQAAKPPLPCGG